MDPFWVLSANLAGQKWMGWETRKELAAKTFSNTPCSVVGFQEFGREINSWDVLGPAHPEMRIYYGNEKEDIDIYLNPIAYDAERFMMVSNGSIWLSESGKPERAWGGMVRATSWAQFGCKNSGFEFLFVNTHLDNKSARARREGTLLNLDLISKLPKLPVIFTADSNVSVHSPLRRWDDPENKTWTDPEMRAPYDLMLAAGFLDSWVETYRTPRYSSVIRPCNYHAFQGERRYKEKGGDGFGTWDTDWILTRGFKVINSTLVDDHAGGMWPSDHYWPAALVVTE